MDIDKIRKITVSAIKNNVPLNNRVSLIDSSIEAAAKNGDARFYVSIPGGMAGSEWDKAGGTDISKAYAARGFLISQDRRSSYGDYTIASGVVHGFYIKW